MKRIFCLLMMLVLASGVYAQDATPEPTPEQTATEEAAPEFPAPGSYSASQRAGGLIRDYEIYMPANFSLESDPVPMIFVLHGAGGNGRGIESFSGFDDLADQEGFIVIYPDSTRFGWNDNRGDGSLAVDDVLFMERVIDYFVANVNVDPQRIYVTGFSRGGMLAYRIGCELRDKVAAVSSVSSGLPWYLTDICGDAAPVPVMMIHGTVDPIIRYEGMPGYLSAEETVDFWLERNGCDSPAEVVMTIDEIEDDDTSIEIESYMRCDDQAEVTLYSVIGAGHTWPGRFIEAPFDLGPVSTEIDAAPVLWEFFQRHTLPSIPEATATEEQ